MYQIILTAEEISSIQALLRSLSAQFRSADESGFLKEAPVIAHELPRRLRVFLNDFKLQEPDLGVCLISNYPIDQAKIGKTPEHWRQRLEDSPTLEEELWLVLCGSLLGDVFGWKTQQDGMLIHNVLPIRGDEHTQLGSASEQSLVWHTEDAFHPYRSDYLGLMCLRNPYQAATTYASIDMLQLDETHARKLAESHFTIRPDLAHLEHLRKGPAATEDLPDAIRDLIARAYEQTNQMNANPPKRAVLFGHPQAPYLCDDPYYMDEELIDDRAALEALRALHRAIEANLSDLILQPGDIAFIDNFKVVHGRKSFTATYDGNDRWLKRINVTRDLRKSRDARLSANSRIIY